MLVECSGRENQPVKGHLSPADVKNLIIESNVKKVVVTHIDPENDHADLAAQIKAGDTEVIIAKDLMEISCRTQNCT